MVGMVSVVLVASGCGGGGKKAGSPTSVPVNTTAPPPGRAHLAMIVVQPGDLPAGWTAKATGSPPNPAAEPTAFARCMGTTNTAADQLATVYSPDFVKGTDVISSIATSFRTRNAVPADTAALTSPKAASCLEEVDRARLSVELPAGGTVRTYNVKVTSGTGGGADNIVATATSTITYTLHGRSLTLNDETVYLVAPRIEARIDFSSAGGAIPAELTMEIDNKVSVRVTFGS